MSQNQSFKAKSYFAGKKLLFKDIKKRSSWNNKNSNFQTIAINLLISAEPVFEKLYIKIVQKTCSKFRNKILAQM